MLVKLESQMKQVEVGPEQATQLIQMGEGQPIEVDGDQPMANFKIQSEPIVIKLEDEEIKDAE